MSDYEVICVELSENALKYCNAMTKGMSGYIFRNTTAVENLHASGGISDIQMKEINQGMVNRLGFCLSLMRTNKLDDLETLITHSATLCKDWDNIDFSVGEADLIVAKKWVSRFGSMRSVWGD